MNESIIQRIDQLQYRLWVGKDDFCSTPQYTGVPWNWILSETLELIEKYSSGISEAVLLSHLQCKWDKFKVKPARSDPLFFGVTDLRSLLQGNNLCIPPSAVLILQISTIEIIKTTSIHIAVLSDSKNDNQISWYFPSRFQQLDKSFLVNRTIRLTGCKLVNSYLYGNRMLPTDFVIIEISESKDIQFIENKSFINLKDLNPHKSISELWIFTKIIKISSVKRKQPGLSHKGVEIKLEDQNQNIIPFILFDDQISLSYLMKKLDFLIIQNPLIPCLKEWKSKSHLQYGPNTIIYIIDQNTCKESNQNMFLSRYNFRVNLPEEQQLVKHRTLLSDIKENTRKISFLAICVDIGPNNPITHDGKSLDRRLVTCSDESMAVFYVTIWDGISKKASTIQPGHVLYFSNVTTTTISNGRFYTNCWEVNKITLMPGIIQSPFFKPNISLLGNIQSHSNFLCQVIICGYILPYSNSTLAPVSNSYHSICYRAITVGNQQISQMASPLHCTFCKSQVPSNQIISVFKIKWKLKDKIKTKIIAEALPIINEQIIEMNAYDFQSLSVELYYNSNNNNEYILIYNNIN